MTDRTPRDRDRGLMSGLRPRIVVLSLLVTVGGVVVPPLAGPSVAAAVPRTCQATHACTDLNGDSYDDAVVGNPYATVNGRAEAGTVTVLFGDADGRIGEGVRQTITQADGGSRPEAGDHFGWSISLNQLGRGGQTTIMVGSPDEDAPAGVDAGIVQVFQFGPDVGGGPGRVIGSTSTQADGGGVIEAGDRFGYSVALGDNRGRDSAYSFVGAPGEDLNGVVDAGVVNAFSSSDAEAVPRLGRDVSEVAQGEYVMPGRPRPGDRFGATLAIADLGVNPYVPWLLIGAPGDEVNGHPGAGSVTVASGFGSSRYPFADEPDVPIQILTQDSPGVPGVAEDGDGFGSSIALGNPYGRDLSDRWTFAIGSPGEDVDTLRDAGAVSLFDSVGPSLRPLGSLTQDVPGWGLAEAGDHFGASVAIRAVDDALMVGVPGEDVGRVRDGGAVSIADGSLSALRNFRTLTLDAAGVPGTAQSGDRFGAAVGGQTGAQENILLAGVTRTSAGSVVVFPRSTPIRAWTAGSGGIPATTRFGAVIRGLEAA